MTFLYRLAFTIVLSLASQPGVLAASRPLELKWGELGPAVQGRRVEVRTSDGSKRKGEIAVVREDSLVMDVQSKGNVSIPREAVTLIKIQGSRGSWGRSLGTVIGVLSGVVVGAYVAIATTDSDAGIPVFLGVTTALTLGGYFTGREIDRKGTVINVVP
ncbi:MAG: hypothetical protein ABIZ80_02735 [Bryobacteraceae bacterium]